ncbi:autotransporter domain-containing protein [Methylotuvimicrobium alcaliphilum]|uniref:Outer membrane autotransporter barrel domain protein n=1 Tax=Methylotuvimicrobium alcaliphilum (strain DSM 19304 / NCIMB 14124 / VKM B-2133 / 20Z) TaxID=1091494 RepID=G4T1Z1_META2|nr:autotransporter domain-containing protein [Methylotuvimicrobium alcaliphilum]CCE24665.1 putative Outer membrane autotransporter barrel domain protein [Methylotuvimicrobium alcaliphilum 20Z]
MFTQQGLFFQRQPCTMLRQLAWFPLVVLLGSFSLSHAAIVAPASVNLLTGQAARIVLANQGETIRITRGPANGALVNNGDGSVSYTPNSDYIGADSFSFAADFANEPITGSGTVSLNVRSIESMAPFSNESQILKVISKSNAPELRRFYENFTRLDPSTQFEVLQSITPLQTAAQINSAAMQSNIQIRNLLYRLDEVRQMHRHEQETGGIKLSANGRTFSLASLFPSQAQGGGAGDEPESGDLLDNRLNVFVNAQYNRNDRITTDLEVGSDSDVFSITIGTDYRFTDALILGAAFGFSDTDTDYQRRAGNLLNRGYSASVYGSYFITDNLYLDGIFTYTGNAYDSQRMLLIPDALGNISRQNSRADFGGDQQRFSIGLGYDLPIKQWTLGVKARTEYGRMNIDAYREKGPTGLNLLVDEQFNESVLTVLGWQVSYAYSAPFGVLLPHLGFDWEHEFKNNSRDMVMRFANDPSLPFVIRTNNPDRDYFIFRAGMSAILANGISSFAQYETLLDQRYETMHTARIGVRWEF